MATQAETIRDTYLIPMIQDFQQLGVYDEKGVCFQDGVIRFTYPNWNTTFKTQQIRKNGTLVAPTTDYTLDATNGWITPVTAMADTDDIVATYWFKYFNNSDLDSYLTRATVVLNQKNPGYAYTANTIDMNRHLAVVVLGAYVDCLKRLVLDSMIWKNNLIWANAQGALSLVQTLLSSAMTEYTEYKADMTRRQALEVRTLKTGRYGTDYTVTGNNFWRYTVLGS